MLEGSRGLGRGVEKELGGGFLLASGAGVGSVCMLPCSSISYVAMSDNAAKELVCSSLQGKVVMR